MTREPTPQERALRAYIAEARWFGGKGRDFELGTIEALPLGIHLVEVVYADSGSDTYQVPIASYADPQDRIGHALIGDWDGRFHYDAAHDREAMDQWLRAFDTGTVVEESGTRLQMHRLPGHQLDLEAHSTIFSGEQSNSSVAFGDDSLMKIFRRVTPGTNPDIEIHRALTEAGSEHVARLYGWVEVSSSERPDEPIQLAMLQQFLRTSTEGWEFALSSVRNLYVEADLHPDEVGGDFAAEAQRLGTAVADVHAMLRTLFPTQRFDGVAAAAGMHARLDAAGHEVPEIAALATPVRAAFDQLAALKSLTGAAGVAQRLHGDLHLGQTLRTSLGWKLVDFEGEPAKPLAERARPDSPWRDVAGMLRSFDYAAQAAQRDFDVDPAADSQLAYRGAEWAHRNREAFLTGYAEATEPLTDADRLVVEAYELDKAVYEAVYEARNRPAWLPSPLAALARAGES
jgi:maltokinase